MENTIFALGVIYANAHLSEPINSALTESVNMILKDLSKYMLLNEKKQIFIRGCIMQLSSQKNIIDPMSLTLDIVKNIKYFK